MAGRPTKYKKEYCEQVIEYMRKGKSLTSFAAFIGTHRQVVYGWMNRHPAFKDACKVAQELSQEWWEDFAMQAATGRLHGAAYKGKYERHNPNMIQFMMSRRFKDYYATNRQQIGIDKGFKERLEAMDDNELIKAGEEALKILKAQDDE